MARHRCTSAVWRATAPVLAVHGGAGRIVPEELGVARAAAARRGLEAGRGAVLTAAGDVEHDAAVADGATRRAGAVTCISGEVLDRLIALTEATFTRMEAWRDAMPDSGQLQDAVQANEATTRTLLSYSPIVIPGLLQTPTYAEHTLRLTNYTGRFDEAAALAGRWRRQEALADRSHRFDFLLPESVLRWSPTGPDVLAAQLERVAMVAAQENVSVGVIRDGQELMLPLHGFTIYADRGEDDPFLSLELAHTYLTLNHPTDVAFYRQLYESLWSTGR